MLHIELVVFSNTPFTIYLISRIIKLPAFHNLLRAVQWRLIILAANDEDVQRVYLLVHNASNPKPRSMCHPGLSPHLYFPTVLHRLIPTPHLDLPDIEVRYMLDHI